MVVLKGASHQERRAGEHAAPADAQVIDLRRVHGGFPVIDVHTHMTYLWDGASGTRPWAQPGAPRRRGHMFLAQANARRTLEAGVTTVRDLGAERYADIADARFDRSRRVMGPRMFGPARVVDGARGAPRQGAGPYRAAPTRTKCMRVARQQVGDGAD